jgi:Uma2 family endonuclease
MHPALPETGTVPATLIPDPERMISDEQYFAFCQANPDVSFERTSRGEIVIVPPAGGESDYQCVEVSGELRAWSKKTRTGKAFGSSAEFILPDRSALSPDAAWASNERLAQLSKTEKRQFLKIVPEFVAEMLSPSDSLRGAKKKMQCWMSNGVELGWLIDADHKTVYIYRQGQETRKVTGAKTLAGESPLEGFVMELDDIWEGL